MMMRFPIAALIGAMTATVMSAVMSPVMAQTVCPTAADLTRGIKVEYADGATEIFRAGDAGIVSVKGLNAEGQGYEMDLAHGLHLVMYQNTENGAPLTVSQVYYDYGIPPAELPIPIPGKRWQSGVTVTASDGERGEPQVHAYDAVVTEMIGDCSYDMISALISYETSDLYTENVHYLPALGIGYLVWNETTDQPRDPVPAVSVSALRK